MTWYSLGLAVSIKDTSEGAWQVAWEVSRAETGHDDSNAIFRKIGPDKRLILFFTPSSQLLAESFGATPCEKPSATGLSLVAGSERAWRIHFGRACGLRLGALHAFQRMVWRGRVNDAEFDEEPLNRHIRDLFEQASATPQKGTSLRVALATWAQENLPQAQMRPLRPAVDALRRAELEDPSSLNALLEATDHQIAQAQSLDDAAWVLLREVTGRMAAAR